MIKYKEFILDNGLHVLIHEDHSSEMAVVNLLYNVGSKNEVPGKTGLAHYFEHLMFGGSKNVRHFDSELERVGGECNAFTSTDITNYYVSLPAINLETALWLESDRMMYLSLHDKSVNTQKQVVIEEFKQRYLNQPYGNAMHHVRALAFKKHPYRWPTIGEKMADIEKFEREDLIQFYQSNYSPDNAILTIAGNVQSEKTIELVKKWFADIPSSKGKKPSPPREPAQLSKRSRKVYAKVPTDALYKVYHVPGRTNRQYLSCDLITDILGFGRSSLFEQRLVKNTSLFANCQAYVLGSVDPGLLVISGKMEKGVEAEMAEMALDEVLETFKTTPIDKIILQKMKNQSEAMKTYETVSLLNRAMKLSYYAHLGNPDLYEKEFEEKLAITGEEILASANSLMIEENTSVVYYKSQPNEMPS